MKPPMKKGLLLLFIAVLWNTCSATPFQAFSTKQLPVIGYTVAGIGVVGLVYWVARKWQAPTPESTQSICSQLICEYNEVLAALAQENFINAENHKANFCAYAKKDVFYWSLHSTITMNNYLLIKTTKDQIFLQCAEAHASETLNTFTIPFLQNNREAICTLFKNMSEALGVQWPTNA